MRLSRTVLAQEGLGRNLIRLLGKRSHLDTVIGSLPGNLNVETSGHPNLGAFLGRYCETVSARGYPPTRMDIDPTLFGRYLDRVMLLEYRGPAAGIRIRLSGSRINALLEKELSGIFLDDYLDQGGGEDTLRGCFRYAKGQSMRRPNRSHDVATPRKHRLDLRDGRHVVCDAICLPLAPLPDEYDVVVAVVLTMTVRQVDGTMKSIGEVKRPLWVNR